MDRCAGILLPIASLPSPLIGDFGPNAYRFVDLIKEAGYKIWQILPLNPLGYGHSPYQPLSSHAIDEIYFDASEFAESKDNPTNARIDYERAREEKNGILKKIFEKSKIKANDLSEFANGNRWVKKWAKFHILKKRNGLKPWNEWDKDSLVAFFKQETIENEKEYLYEIWVQKILYEQWDKLKRYANGKGIKIIGDIPFYVGYDSVDVLDNRDLFLLDEEYEPTFVAGVPPDYFSEFGQRWGNPIYDFKKMKEDGYSFILDRIISASKLYDVIRLDHFRAFDTYYMILSSCPTAIEGHWEAAPGYEIFDLLEKKAPNIDIIAEDLGDLREAVLTLRDHYNLPGMGVVPFIFEDEEFLNKRLIKKNMVVYLGTHDNEPFISFFDGLGDEKKNKWIEALGEKGIKDDDVADRFIKYALYSEADYAIFSIQDVLGLGIESRINRPGEINDDNWMWKMGDFLQFEKKLPKLKKMNEESGR